MVELRVFNVSVRRHRMLTKAIVQLALSARQMSSRTRLSMRSESARSLPAAKATRIRLADLARISDEYDISGANLDKFLSAAVTARLDDDRFWAGLARLSGEYVISGAKLDSLMPNSVAARLDDDRFWAGLA